MDWINGITETIDLISEGIDPSTGELIDTEILKNDPAFQAALKKLSRKYRKSRNKGVYAKYEKEYPNHTIIMKEGYFYSVHNKSAYVLNRVLDYSLAPDMFGRPTTGCPVYERIANALQDEGISFILVEAGELIERFDGDDPFEKYGISEETCKDNPSGEMCNDETPDEGNEEIVAPPKPNEPIYPENLLKALYGVSRHEYPEDVESRINTVLDSNVLFSGRYSRDAECVRSYYKKEQTLREIGESYDLSHERIRQLIQRALKKLRRTAVQAYITGETDNFNPTKKTDKNKSRTIENPIILPEDTFEVAEDSITISEMARRLSAITIKSFGIRFRFTDIATWLVSAGDMVAFQDGETTIRTPTEQGMKHGIVIGKKINSAGFEYSGLFLEPTAQKYIWDNLETILDHMETEQQ